MSDLFENSQQQDFFKLPERPEDYKQYIPPAKGETAAGLFEKWNEGEKQRQAFRDELLTGHGGAALSMREAEYLFDMKERNLLEDDDIYKMMSAREIGEFYGYDPNFVYENYDAFLKTLFGDREKRYPSPKSLYEAWTDSLQIAKNMEPLGRMGIELKAVHDRMRYADDDEKQALQEQAGKLWEEISAIQKANEGLSKRMPTDALSSIITGTVQSAPLTLKAMLGGGIGAAAGGGLGFLAGGPAGAAAGFKAGYNFGSFTASSAEMTGMLYIDLIAAGVERENASRLALLGGGINGFIESGLGVVAGWGKSAAKAAGGALLSKEAQAKIAEAASKNFITRISASAATTAAGRFGVGAAKTAFDLVKQAGEEGLEEGLQFLVEQAMYALGDALQDAPVDRDLWGSPAFQAEMKRSVMGGVAGGIGFGVVGLPLTVTGNAVETARQVKDLKNLAAAIDDKAEFRAAAKESPLAQGLSDEQIDQMHDSQEPERREHNLRARMEAEKQGRMLASMPTPEAPGEMRRGADGRLDTRITMPAEGETSGTMKLIDKPTSQRFGGLDFSVDIDSNTIAIEGVTLSEAVTDREAVIGDMVKELSYANPGMNITWDPDARMNEAAGADLAAVKNRLAEANPRGAEHGLSYYREGDDFGLTREIHGDIERIARVFRMGTEQARDNWRVMNTAAKFGVNAHEMIQGLLTEEELRSRAAENPKGVEAQAAGMLDKGRIAAQQTGQNVGGGIVAIKRGVDGGPDQILHGNEAMKENFERLRAITVVTENSNPATLLHEWMHWMTSFVIPNSPRYKTLLEEAAGKAFGEEIKLEDFKEKHHEWVTKNFEHYMKTGEAPTAGLRAVFRRIAEALKELFSQWTGNPELKRYFDELLAGPESGSRRGAESESRARVKTDNAQQKAFAEMTTAQRIAQSDVHTPEEKAAMLFAMSRAPLEKLDPADRAHGPTAALIARAMAIADETERQSLIADIRELRRRYEGTAAEYTAPNGENSLLLDALGQEKGREAWYAVRTENFKKWFGDWETEADAEWVFNTEPVKRLEGSEFAKSEKDLVAQVDEFFKSIGGKVEREGLGTVVLNRRGAKNSIAHGTGREKSAAFMAVPDIIKNGRIIDYKTNWKGRGYDTYVIDAPITIGNVDYIAEVIIEQNKSKRNIFYLHEVEVKEKAQSAFKTATKRGAPQASKLIISRKLSEVKENVSKIVDENGEPLAVFHQTQNEFDVYDPRRGGAGAGDGQTPYGIFLKPDAKDLGLGSIQMPLFADIKNPLPAASRNNLEQRLKTIPEYAELSGKVKENDAKYGKLLDEAEAEEDKTYKQWWEGNRTQQFKPDGKAETVLNTWQEENGNINGRMKDLVQDYLKKNGHDGLTLEHDEGSYGRSTKTIIALEPAQVKSATDNAGTFDQNNFSILFQTAWHGSAFRFNRFDIEKMGQGRGMQAYGWGHYFASRFGTADYYRRYAAERHGLFDKTDNQKFDGRTMAEWHARFEQYTANKKASEAGHILDRMEMLEKLMASYDYQGTVDEAKKNKYSPEAVKWFEQTFKEFETPGQTYEVSIPDDDKLLDWDKEINRQPEAVKKALDKISLKINVGKNKIIREYNGRMLYEALEGALKSDKAASLYLHSLGIKGLRYMDVASRAKGEGYRSTNRVIFSDKDIKITDTVFQGVSSKSLFGILFQMTREDINAEALKWPSWRDWMNADVFAEAVSEDRAAYRLDDAAAEPRGQEELEAWYEKQWNEARVLAREAALGDDGIRTEANAEEVDTAQLDGSGAVEEEGSLDWDPDLYEEEKAQEGQKEALPSNDTAEDAQAAQEGAGGRQGANSETGAEEENAGPITTSEANRRLISKLPNVIDDYLLVMGQTMRQSLEHFGAVTEEDAAMREQAARDKERIFREVHPYVRGVALRAAKGKKINEQQRRRAMSHMRRSLESGATVYRELYTSLTEDKEFRAYAEHEVADTGAAGEAQRAASEAKGLTAFQRTRLAEGIIDKDIARRIRGGRATSEEIEDYIRRRNEEIRELDDTIKNLEGELEKSRGETAEERGEADRWYRHMQKTRTELKAAKKEAAQLEKKLESSRQARANTTERMKAARENAEAKLKEKLSAKREEISVLRKRIKEETAYARAQGRIEVSWKWAEERRKLDKMEADRKRRNADKKAAAKYLEANKKLAAYVMSADRVGMNVWVRQRELILGIQNALFKTSKDAARLRELDAEIKDIEKKIDKEINRLERAEGDDAAMVRIQQQIDEYEAYRENLKSARQYIDIMAPGTEGVKTGQEGEGADTVDTGTVRINGRTISVEEFRQQFYEHKIRYGFMDAKLRKALRRDSKTLGEKRKAAAAVLARSLSQEELLAVKEVIRQLNLEGRANWERRQFAIRLRQEDLVKTFLQEQDELKDEGKTGPAKRYAKAMETADIEKRKKLLGKREEWYRRWFESWDDKRLLQWMSGDQKGALYRYVIRERLRYANRRDVAIDNRTSRILDIMGQGTPEQQEAEQNLNEAARKRKNGERAQQRIRELGEKNITIEGVGPRKATRTWELDAGFRLKDDSVLEAPTSVQVSLADLMFLAVAMDNKFARSHYLYGNLWSDDERAIYEPKKGEKISAKAMESVKAIGLNKELKIRKAIDQHLFEDDGKGGRKAKGDLLKIVDAIRDDFETHFSETRSVYEDMFNQVVEGQDNYLPLIITEGKHGVDEKQSEIEALTQGSYQVRISPDKGMMMSRVDIGATHQAAIETDIFKVFFKGVDREEHFAKFAPYVRDLNVALRGRNNGSKQLAGNLKDMYGQWAMNRLYQHINMEGLPPSAKVGDAMENAAGLGRLLAGNAGVAYIAYNIPAWLAQYPNSIAAFFGKADARFILASCLEAMKPGNDLAERVYAKSPKVKQRVINVAEEYRQYLAEQPGKLDKARAKIIEIGMMGQKHADKAMVAAGWWALYQTALKNGMSEEDAVVHADEITAETQPDLHPLETSPMYKEGGLGNLFLRFSQPLNMVWQNFTYDSFVSREKTFGSTVARITAYGIAALLVAAMRGALAKQDGEDEPEERIRKVFYYLLFSQFSESVPLVGNMVSGTVEKLVTGEGNAYSNRYFELAERVLDIPITLTQENYERAVTDAIHVLGLGAGLPVSQSKRIIKAVREENPWIIFGFDPQSGKKNKR